jgi:hypothetical protein
MSFSPDPLLRMGHGPFDPGSLFSDIDLVLAFSACCFQKLQTRAQKLQVSFAP